MANPAEKARNFFINPDAESRAKTRFVSYYIGTYLNIISGTRDRIPNLRYRRILYLDFFCGPGKYDTGEDSVPLLVLTHAKLREKPINNIYFYFNDLNLATELEGNIKEKFHTDRVPNYIHITQKDSTTINLSSLIDKNDIVMSFVDSFSYLLCDTRTISKLIANQLSDCIFYINFQHFYRFIDAESEREKFINFFGSEDAFESARKMFHETRNKDELASLMMQDFIRRLDTSVGQRLYYLPVFFRNSTEDTAITQIIMVVSKSPKGPDAIRGSFCEFGDKDKPGSINENFYLDQGRITVYENTSINQMSLFEHEEKMEKYAYPMSFLPDSLTSSITRSELLSRIDQDYRRKNLYLSGYSEKYLTRMLSYLEDNQMIEVVNTDPSRRKRRIHTYPDTARIYRKKARQ